MVNEIQISCQKKLTMIENEDKKAKSSPQDLG